MLEHGSCVLVCDRTLRGCQLLVLDELLLSLSVATCTGGRNIRIVTTVRLYLLLEMLVADRDHGAVRSVRAAVNTLTLLVDLRTVALSTNEDDVTLVNSGVI